MGELTREQHVRRLQDVAEDIDVMEGEYQRDGGDEEGTSSPGEFPLSRHLPRQPLHVLSEPGGGGGVWG